MARFRFGKHLGSGGFGLVRSATRMSEDGATVVEDGLAVKSLNVEHLADEDAVARFVREVRLLDEELDHANVMPVIARNLSASPPWFVMPYAESNLANELEAGRAGERDWVIEAFAGTLEGMAHAHDHGVLHRDLKPPNVLFCGGVPKVADFGLGKRLDPEATKLTKTDMWMGTEPYMAPSSSPTQSASGRPPTSTRWERCSGRC